jgi:hypothetical protein
MKDAEEYRKHPFMRLAGHPQNDTPTPLNVDSR